MSILDVNWKPVVHTNVLENFFIILLPTGQILIEYLFKAPRISKQDWQTPVL